MTKPIKLWSNAQGPNPRKVVILFHELGLSYETVNLDMKSVKEEPFTNVNPNGRVPAIEDPNTGVTVWESNAILEYLIEQYDTSNKLSFTSSPEKYHIKQWLFFQASGQGPYMGQHAWFSRYHHEKLPSAIQRYANETKRILMVMNTALKGKDYLVGDKCTYADLSFIPWFHYIPIFFQEDKIDIAGEYPNYHAWMERLAARPAVKKTLEDRSSNNGQQ